MDYTYVTYAESHIANMLSTPGAAADQAAQQKISKYASLASTPICPIENMECHGYRVSTGDWATHPCHHRRLRENHIFVLTPVDSLSTGECVSFQNTMTTE